jgi:tetrahydromethanopterin S-methyltransferase subunit H
LEEFNRFDLQKRGELDDHEAMMLLESRGETKTAVELRQMVKDIDKDGNHRVSFVEWCCAVYDKPYNALNDFADDAAREAAMAQAKLAGDKARAAAALIQAAKDEEERKAVERAAQLEAESKLTGVRGMGAFFSRQIEQAGDATLSNEQRVS